MEGLHQGTGYQLVVRYVYAPSNVSDRLMQLDSRTGNVVEFLLPTELDTKKIGWTPRPSSEGVATGAQNVENRAIKEETRWAHEQGCSR